jgi:hypothetical protein
LPTSKLKKHPNPNFYTFTSRRPRELHRETQNGSSRWGRAATTARRCALSIEKQKIEGEEHELIRPAFIHCRLSRNWKGKATLFVSAQEIEAFLAAPSSGDLQPPSPLGG